MNPVSPKLARARYIGGLPWLIVPAIAVAVAAWLWTPWLWIAVAVLVAIIAWLLWLIPAQVKLMGWQETDNELLIQKGKLWHSLTVVPYGRIQFVDVQAGPVDRHFGLKSIELHTASSTSDSQVPGLTGDEADALRERLTIKARERMSGL